MKKKTYFLAVIFILSLLGTTSQAADLEQWKTINDKKSKFLSLKLVKNPEKKRNVYGPPLLSVFLPGFDQWYEDQKGPGILYSGTAFLGLKVQFDAAFALSEKVVAGASIEERDDTIRRYALGSQIYQAAGGFSAYASFRSAVRSRVPHGEYSFLVHEETTEELLLAPFEFSQFKKPRIFVPLLLLAGYAAYSWNDDTAVGSGKPFGINDVFFASAFSFNAGTHEEAVFRGWLMPAAMEETQSKFWSNASTSLLFAAAHISEANPLPIPQLVLGYYFGYLVQENDWKLNEAIFLHTWWDVLAFSISYLWDAQHGSIANNKTITLPPIRLTF